MHEDEWWKLLHSAEFSKFTSVLHERWKESAAKIEKVGQRKEILSSVLLFTIKMVSDDKFFSSPSLWVKRHQTLFQILHCDQKCIQLQKMTSYILNMKIHWPTMINNLSNWLFELLRLKAIFQS